MYVRHIPEYATDVPHAGRLGRHVRHDPRSLTYLYPAHLVDGLASVRHERWIPVLDQGDLGSCTGNAAERARPDPDASGTVRPADRAGRAAEAVDQRRRRLAQEARLLTCASAQALPVSRPHLRSIMSKYRKFITALLAAAGVFATSGLLSGTAELVLNTVIAAAGAALVALVPNEQARRTAPAREHYPQPGQM